MCEEHDFFRAEPRGRLVVELVAGVGEVPGHLEVGLGKPMEIPQSQHPREKTSQVIHGRSEISSIRVFEDGWESHVVGTRELYKLCHDLIGRVLIPLPYPAHNSSISV